MLFIHFFVLVSFVKQNYILFVLSCGDVHCGVIIYFIISSSIIMGAGRPHLTLVKCIAFYRIDVATARSVTLIKKLVVGNTMSS